MKPIALLAGVLAGLALSTVNAAQKADPGTDKLIQQYVAAFNQGDAKALAALYTADGFRLTPMNQVIAGRASIEQFYLATFASKPPALTVKPGRTQMLSADAAVTEGAYELASTPAARGVYVLTLVRQSGQWKLASVVPVPDTR